MTRSPGAAPESHAPTDRALLLWLPVGAGSHVVPHTSRWWEHLQAHRDRRAPQPLFHAALELVVRDDRITIEMAPAWSAGGVNRGVVATGPVGVRGLGRFRLFRYEIRCWYGGTIPDRQWAVGEPTVVSEDATQIQRLLAQIRYVPPLIWGREVTPIGDMWNSNSLVSWLLTRAGMSTQLSPPHGGRAPGWEAGIAVATGPPDRERLAHPSLPSAGD